MLVKPDREDLRIIAHTLGRVLNVTAVAGLLPFAWALAGREWHPLGSFALMIGVFLLLGQLGLRHPPRSERLDWGHGMVVVAITWVVVPVVGAIPFMLSGHYGSPLDAVFDALSGLSTTGLSLVQDLDHIAPSLNFWRHLLHFLGGQGIVIAALLLFAGGGGLTLYYGEAREERFMPSVRSTARFIWSVALVHLAAGVLLLGFTAHQVLGFSWVRAFFHGLMIFFAGFDTGGFSPQSTSLAYYHSAVFEAVTAVMMVSGAMSFGVHFALWSGRRRTVLRNLETRTILGTFVLTLGLTIVGLALTGVHTTITGLSREGFFQVLSAHTGTGFATVSSAELGEWSGLAFAGMTLAMGLGGMASSTAGGVKSLRVGLTIKAIATQVRQLLLPEHATVRTRYEQGGRRTLSPDLAQSVMVVSLLYVALFGFGALVGIATGADVQPAIFESVSAGANVGLSVGLTEPGMPLALKITYMLQMWAGRLEFVAIFALIGFAWSSVRGR